MNVLDKNKDELTEIYGSIEELEKKAPKPVSTLE
jgi:hypothetical protein